MSGSRQISVNSGCSFHFSTAISAMMALFYCSLEYSKKMLKSDRCTSYQIVTDPFHITSVPLFITVNSYTFCALNIAIQRLWKMIFIGMSFKNTFRTLLKALRLPVGRCNAVYPENHTQPRYTLRAKRRVLYIRAGSTHNNGLLQELQYTEKLTTQYY
jgi:hypothetical protein